VPWAHGSNPPAAPSRLCVLPSPLLAVPAMRFMERGAGQGQCQPAGPPRPAAVGQPCDYRRSAWPTSSSAAAATSRLWKRIRENRGLSYDVRSGITWGTIEEHSTWTFSAIFAPANQPKVEAAFQEELARSLKDGFTAEVLQSSCVRLLDFRRLSRAQDGNVAGRLANRSWAGAGNLAACGQCPGPADCGRGQRGLAQVHPAQPARVGPRVTSNEGDFQPHRRSTLTTTPAEHRTAHLDHAAPAGAELPRGQALQEFVVEQVLGMGGYSVVYLVQDTKLQRKVAMKEYLPGTLAARPAQRRGGAAPAFAEAYDEGPADLPSTKREAAGFL